MFVSRRLLSVHSKEKKSKSNHGGGPQSRTSTTSSHKQEGRSSLSRITSVTAAAKPVSQYTSPPLNHRKSNIKTPDTTATSTSTASTTSLSDSISTTSKSLKSCLRKTTTTTTTTTRTTRKNDDNSTSTAAAVRFNDDIDIREIDGIPDKFLFQCFWCERERRQISEEASSIAEKGKQAFAKHIESMIAFSNNQIPPPSSNNVESLEKSSKYIQEWSASKYRGLEKFVTPMFFQNRMKYLKQIRQYSAQLKEIDAINMEELLKCKSEELTRGPRILAQKRGQGDVAAVGNTSQQHNKFGRVRRSLFYR